MKSQGLDSRWKIVLAAIALSVVILVVGYVVYARERNRLTKIDEEHKQAVAENQRLEALVAQRGEVAQQLATLIADTGWVRRVVPDEKLAMSWQFPVVAASNFEPELHKDLSRLADATGVSIKGTRNEDRKLRTALRPKPSTEELKGKTIEEWKREQDAQLAKSDPELLEIYKRDDEYQQRNKEFAKLCVISAMELEVEGSFMNLFRFVAGLASPEGLGGWRFAQPVAITGIDSTTPMSAKTPGETPIVNAKLKLVAMGIRADEPIQMKEVGVGEESASPSGGIDTPGSSFGGPDGVPVPGREGPPETGGFGRPDRGGPGATGA